MKWSAFTPFRVVLALVLVAGCASSHRGTTTTTTTTVHTRPHHGARPHAPAAGGVGDGATQRGMASWYGGKHGGGPTASGERMDARAMTAAHRTLHMNTRVRVTNQKNGRSVVVRINDRGPYGRGRIIDLSRAAAEAIDMIDAGVVPVRLEVLR